MNTDQERIRQLKYSLILLLFTSIIQHGSIDEQEMKSLIVLKMTIDDLYMTFIEEWLDLDRE
jgi:uncharacterized membrane protein YcaP (DUF421 family)